jgi:UDP-glucose 4-epimerase
MKTLFLTGATGMVGGGILEYFYEAGWKIILAEMTPAPSINDERIEVVPFDLSAHEQDEVLKNALKRSDLVIHTAAVLPSRINESVAEERQYLFTANVMGTTQLMRNAVEQGVGQFICISTSYKEEKVPPDNYYKLSKWLVERMAHDVNWEGKTKFSTLRISAPYGPCYNVKAVIPMMIERVLKGQDIELWGDGSREQTFTYVGDIARACGLVFDESVEGVFNVTGQGSVTMKTLAETVLMVIPNTGSRIVFADKDDPNQGVSRKILIEEARKVFGYVPIYDLKAGLTETISKRQKLPKVLSLIKKMTYEYT